MSRVLKSSSSGLRPGLGILLALLLVSGCAGPLKQLAYSVRESPENAGFAPAILRGKRVGFLTATVTTGNEQYRSLTTLSLARAFSKLNSELGIILVPPRESLNRINANGLSEEYARMMLSYERTGVLKKETISRIGKAMGVDYVVQPSLVKFSQHRNVRVTFFGVRLVETVESSVRVSMELWDCESGKDFWNGWAVVTVAGEDVRAKYVPFEEVAEIAYGRLLSVLAREDLKKGKAKEEKQLNSRNFFLKERLGARRFLQRT